MNEHLALREGGIRVLHIVRAPAPAPDLVQRGDVHGVRGAVGIKGPHSPAASVAAQRGEVPERLLGGNVVLPDGSAGTVEPCVAQANGQHYPRSG